MKACFPQIKMMGERAILIEFHPEISEKLLDEILFYKKLLQKKLSKEKVEVTNTFSSLLILYHVDIENIYSEFLELKLLLESSNIDKKAEASLFHIPVCYDLKFGIDLEYISMEIGLPVEQIIKLHYEPVYTVYFIGFLPGFLYLGGLKKELEISRKASPRKRVEKGAVGIGEKQTGIYPKPSPGGWQIIGNSPIEIFDKNSSPPCQILAGDKIKFYSVSRGEYEDIKTRVANRKFHLRKEDYHG